MEQHRAAPGLLQELWQRGYMVLPARLSNNNMIKEEWHEKLLALLASKATSPFHKLLDSADNTIVEHRGQMANMDPDDSNTKKFMSWCGYAVIDKLNASRTYEAASPVFLRSQPNGKEQMPHADFARTSYWREDYYAFSAVVALQDGTTVKFWSVEDGEWVHEYVVLAAREVVLFRGDWPHAGCRYTEHNDRLHVYFKPVECPLPVNKVGMFDFAGKLKYFSQFSN